MWKKTSVLQLLKWLFCFAGLFLGSRGAVVNYKWLWLSCMLMHNASETTLRNVKRFRNPGATLKLMVATLWEASSLLVPQSKKEKGYRRRKTIHWLYEISMPLTLVIFTLLFFLCDILKIRRLKLGVKRYFLEMAYIVFKN